MIVTTPLRRALADLQRNVGWLDSPLARERPQLVPTFRSAVIQSFEVTYEVAIRLLERAIADRHGAQAVDAADFRTRIRMAMEAGLIASLDTWLRFRSMRNITSHTYDAAKAEIVCAGVPEFMTAITELLSAMDRSGHAS